MAGARHEIGPPGLRRSASFPLENVIVFDDIDIARAGAHGEDDGGVMIIGTGSAAMALVNGKRHPVRRLGLFCRRHHVRRDSRARIAAPLASRLRRARAENAADRGGHGPIRQ